MNMNDINKEVEKLLNSQLANISKEIDSLVTNLNDYGTDKELKDDIELLKSYNQFIKRKDRLSGKKKIFRTITVASNIDSQLDILGAYMHQSAHSNQSSSLLITSGIINKIKSKIKKLSIRLWQFLSQIMSLHQWSIAGSTNLNIFGLSGGVQLQITFE